MPDDVVTLPGTGAGVAVDNVSGVEYQLVKLVDATEDSITRTGIDAHPLVAEARLAFVDFDDSIVPVTDNGDNHWLPVVVRNEASVNVTTFGTTAPVAGSVSDTPLTGPSDGTWGGPFNINSGRVGMLRLSVTSTGGTPTVAAFGSADGINVDQQLPLVVPDGDSLVLADTFTPGVGARFCYILSIPEIVEIRAVSGGTSAPVVATLTGDAFQPPIVATVRSGAQPITDNGGSITVDGSVTATISGAVPITDNSGSITVDNGGTFAVQADTELPAAAALADGASNPTTPTAGSAGLVYNGTTWDRARGDTTSGMWVNVKAGTVSSSGSDSTPNVNRKVKVTATLSSVNDTASNTTLLPSNSNRLGFTMVNDSTSILYVRLSASAAVIAAGSYNYILQPGDTLEHPGPAGIYTGQIQGIWSADASGWVAITEYS